MDQKLYNELNKAWKSTCKVIFGEEIGELKEYEEWLNGYMPPLQKAKSHLSGKEVVLATNNYCEEAKFVSEDELKKANASLNINEIKDIDSVLGAISEKWEYVGNQTQGVSSSFESSTQVNNSHYVANTITTSDSMYLYATYRVGVGKYAFGCANQSVKSEFLIRCLRGNNMVRSFEAHYCDTSSDAYLSHYCHGSHNILFCFNQKFKRNCIGNLELPLEKFTDLKRKLVGEIREELKKDKKFPSLLELVPNEAPGADVIVNVKERTEATDMKPLEKAFSSTSKILFNKELVGLLDYEKWLSSYLALPRAVRSPFGNMTSMHSLVEMNAYRLMPEKRVITYEESIELVKLRLKEDEISSLGEILKNISKIGYFTTAAKEGQNRNVIKSYATYNYVNTYDVHRSSNIENAAIVISGHRAKFLFGCRLVRESEFCMKCHNSGHMNRCFEVDLSDKCSDAYFCHNCENLHDAMFCFNVKNLNYAIGNAALPQDQYKGLKGTLIAQIADELEKKKSLSYDIFTIGCGKA